MEEQMSETVILVDQNDHEIGIEEKINAHEKGQLHRAFSVFIINAKGEMLLQQRADSKYHSGGLWSNACCSHPKPGENVEQAAHRRLIEEMGFDCALEDVFRFRYRAELDRGLIEHEFDHVCIGRFDGEPEPDPEEVSAYRWIDLQTLAGDMRVHPERYAPWFALSFDRVVSVLKDGIG